MSRSWWLSIYLPLFNKYFASLVEHFPYKGPQGGKKKSICRAHVIVILECLHYLAMHLCSFI